MSGNQTRPVVIQLCTAAMDRTADAMLVPPAVGTTAANHPLWAYRHCGGAAVGAYGVTYALVFVTAIWAGASSSVSTVAAVICALAALVTTAGALGQTAEAHAIQLRYADLQFSYRAVTRTLARAQAAALTVPLAAALEGPLLGARAEIWSMCRALRDERELAAQFRSVLLVRNESVCAAGDVSGLHPRLALLTAAVLTAEEALAMVSSVAVARIDVPDRDTQRGAPRGSTQQILDVLFNTLEQ